MARNYFRAVVAGHTASPFTTKMNMTLGFNLLTFFHGTNMTLAAAASDEAGVTDPQQPSPRRGNVLLGGLKVVLVIALVVANLRYGTSIPGRWLGDISGRQWLGWDDVHESDTDAPASIQLVQLEDGSAPQGHSSQAPSTLAPTAKSQTNITVQSRTVNQSNAVLTTPTAKGVNTILSARADPQSQTSTAGSSAPTVKPPPTKATIQPLNQTGTSSSTPTTMVMNATLSTNNTRKDPIFVVGFPKSGTTTIWSYFNCSGVRANHYCARSSENHPPCPYGTMAKCLINNLRKDIRPLLKGCGEGEFDVFAQIDGERPTANRKVLLEDGPDDPAHKMRLFFPQHFNLPELHRDYPTATFILNLRPPEAWAKSVMNWFHVRMHIFNEYYFTKNVTDPNIFPNGSYPKREEQLDTLVRIYEDHTRCIREFVKLHPSHTLVEVPIQDPNAGQIMQEAFGHSSTTCWGHANANTGGNRTQERLRMHHLEKAKRQEQKTVDQ